MMGDLKITSFEDLVAAAQGEVVELPPFAEGHPFVARLKRPSMLEMVKSGTIPNELLVEANKLFAKGAGKVAIENQTNPSMMKDMFIIMDEMCKASFVEPTYEEIKKSGVQLTDEQQMFVFSYSQSGVKALKSFRQQRGNSQDSGNTPAA